MIIVLREGYLWCFWVVRCSFLFPCVCVCVCVCVFARACAHMHVCKMWEGSEEQEQWHAEGEGWVYDTASHSSFCFCVSEKSSQHKISCCFLTVISLVVLWYLFSLFCLLVNTYKWKWKSLSRVWLFATPWTIQSMEFSRLEYWRGYLFPSPGDLPNPGI